MGTRGLRIVKYRGRYWIFYNHYDSYFEGMGDSLVGIIPTDPEGYQKWLLAQRAFFEKWDNLLQKKLCIHPDQLLDLDGEGSYREVWKEMFDERLEEDEPTHDPGSLDIYIEYIYTFDLDLEVFSIDNSAHYRLDQIPRDGKWMKAVFKDDEGHRFVHPKYAPAESLANLTVENGDFSVDALPFWNSLNTREVKPKASSRSIVSKMRWKLFKLFRWTQQDNLSVTLLGWTSDSLPFRELVFCLLCLAAGGSNLAVVDERRIIDPYCEERYAGMVLGCKPDGDRELISSVGVGYHMQGQPTGSSPHAAKYWFEGALVCLVPRLEQPDVLKKAISDAVRYGREGCCRNSFNALLISIEHLVLLRSFLDGRVEHSPLMPLVSIGMHRSMDAHQRYGNDWLDNFDAPDVSELDSVKAELSESSSQSSSDQTMTSDENDSKANEAEKDSPGGSKDTDDREKGEERIPLEDIPDGRKLTELSNQDLAEGVGVWTTKDTFMSLIQFLESTALDGLKPTGNTGLKLPIEIITIILRSVSDIETFNACAKVSRAFRDLCHERPLLMDDVVLLEPTSELPLGTKAGAKGKMKQARPDFHAMELSTGRQMGVKITCNQHKREYRVVVGSERDRKSFIPPRQCPINFEGLVLSARWEQKRHRINRAWQTSPPIESSGSLWEKEYARGHLDVRSDTQRLGDFWQRITGSLFGMEDALRGTPLRPADSDKRWLMPPSTRQYLASTSVYAHEEYFHFLLLRLKRASPYWDTLWDDIIREAKDSLGSVDEDFDLDLREDDPERAGQVVGAHDPLVMLVVGLEVRLFKWEQGFPESVVGEARKKASPYGTLTEFEPGRTYSITEADDREVIERFLIIAAERLKAAKLKERKR